MLTAGANWCAEPIRGRRRLAALTGDEAYKPGRPGETQFDVLICKKMKRGKEEMQRRPMSCFKSGRCFISSIFFSLFKDLLLFIINPARQVSFRLWTDSIYSATTCRGWTENQIILLWKKKLKNFEPIEEFFSTQALFKRCLIMFVLNTAGFK